MIAPDTSLTACYNMAYNALGKEADAIPSPDDLPPSVVRALLAGRMDRAADDQLRHLLRTNPRAIVLTAGERAQF